MSHVHDYLQAFYQHQELKRQVVYHKIFDEKEAHYTPYLLSPKLTETLRAYGIEKLYDHQAKAIHAIMQGKDIVLTSPTASGKSMVYTLPVLEAFLQNPHIHALYIFPLKALARDQYSFLQNFIKDWDKKPGIALYDGDCTPYERQKIRKKLPNILITNPDMLNLGIMPSHTSWREFFANLSFIVLDEAHTYRGVFGSHMAQIFRRIQRICEHYAAKPRRILCTATIGNPEELAQKLLGSTQAELITKSGAPQGKKHILLVNPEESPASYAISLIKSALKRNLRTIVYCRSRKMTELISLWATKKNNQYRHKINAYRAGFLPEERREIEEKMSNGELGCIVSTSALELGIDIGNLDLCILVGYPGTIMSTLQRSGRVGRKGQESAIFLLAGEDALDQYFMQNPEEFFNRPPENTIINTENPYILQKHLECAASELVLEKGEPWLQENTVQDEVQELCMQGLLLQDEAGEKFYASRKRPHLNIDLRGSGATFNIIERIAINPQNFWLNTLAEPQSEPQEEIPVSSNSTPLLQAETPQTQAFVNLASKSQIIGTVDLRQAYMETHEGAIYLHNKQQYLVDSLDFATKTIYVHKENVLWHTRARTNKNTEILEVLATCKIFGFEVGFGKLKVTENLTGYERRQNSTLKLLSIESLDYPPLTFETEGLWFIIPDYCIKLLEDKFYHFMGSIHAFEHITIGLMPLVVMADRNDIGGISIPFFPALNSPAVFIYDGSVGGAGLCKEAFTKLEILLKAVLSRLESCPCEIGCPSCVISPKCGSGNRPIDKDGAKLLLQTLINNTSINTPLSAKQIQTPAKIQSSEQNISVPAKINSEEFQTIMVLDMETRYSADEVGGWHNAHLMGVSIAVLFDGKEYQNFTQDRLDEMFALMKQADLVVGFNTLNFDYKVLQPFCAYNLWDLPSLDMLHEIKNRLNYRVSLDNLASSTFNMQKSADGLKALEWWKQGKLDKITEYCTQDVRLTKELFEFARENSYLLFTNKAGQKVRIPTVW